jgi:hypothetical protein
MGKCRGCPGKGKFVLRPRVGGGKWLGNDFLALFGLKTQDIGRASGETHYIWVVGKNLKSSKRRETPKEKWRMMNEKRGIRVAEQG